MAKENIELHIIHNPKFNTEDNGFGIAIFIDGVDKSVLELSQEQMLHIGAILLNGSRKLINNSTKIEPKDYNSIDPHFGKPIDKIEPIFNVGDKIQYSKGCGTIMTIEKIKNGEYIFGNNMGHITIENGNKWYLVNHVEQKSVDWSEEQIKKNLQDNSFRRMFEQKPAECRQEIKLNGGIVYEDFNEGDGYYKVNLAYLSKSQVELIENLVSSWQNSADNTTAWSEEDGVRLQRIIDFLWHNRKGDTDAIYQQEQDIDWLKSLKERYIWKPSDEQMNAFDAVFYNPPRSNESRNHLITLYNELKKLRGEINYE